MAKKEKRDVLIPYKFLPIFETLSKQCKFQQATELMIAILRFDMFGEEPGFTDDGVAFVWESVIKPQLEENIQKYKAFFQIYILILPLIFSKMEIYLKIQNNKLKVFRMF